MDDLFAPPEHSWQRLAPHYRSMRRLTSIAVPALVSTVPAVVIGVLSGRWWVSAGLWFVALAIAGWRLGMVGKVWRSWGYVERDDDLYLTHGVLWRTLVAVPYGRMQVVEVTSGPVQRAFGLATVILRTASPRTRVHIPGLAPDEAARLRDQLTRLGEQQAIAL